MYTKNHPIIPVVVPSYFKINLDKKEKIRNALTHLTQVLKWDLGCYFPLNKFLSKKVFDK